MRGNILLLCPEVCQGDVANWKELNTHIERVAAYQRTGQYRAPSSASETNSSYDNAREVEGLITQPLTLKLICTYP